MTTPTREENRIRVGTAMFGWIGLSKVFPEWRAISSNTGVSNVHGICGEALYPGAVNI